MGGWRLEVLPAAVAALELPVRFGLVERLREIHRTLLELAE